MKKIKITLRKLKSQLFPPQPSLTESRLKQLVSSCNDYIAQNRIVPHVKILWPTVFNQDQTWWAHDGVLINALKLRGAEIIPTMCDKLQSDQCVIHGGLWQSSYEQQYGQTRQTLCAQCVNHDLKLWDLLQIKPIKLSSFLSAGESVEIWNTVDTLFQSDWQNSQYESFPMGQEILKAVLNNNMQGVIKPFWEMEAKKIARYHAYNVIALMKTYTRILDVFSPDLVVGNGGFYYQWGVLHHLAQRKNMPYYRYYAIGLMPLSWNYALNTNDIVDLAPAWESWKKHAWDEEKVKKVKKDLIKRGLSFDIESKMDISKRLLKIRQDLKLEGNKPTMLLFSGIIWDAATNVKSKAFDNMYEWIFSTIEWFAKNPQYQLIIRSHPAENVGPTVAQEQRTKFEKELRERQIPIPPNVFIIKTDDDVDTYDVMHLSDLGAVYTSTTGLEYACLGKPLIAVGPAHFRDKDFTYDPNSRDEYEALLASLLGKKALTETMMLRQENAMKYWHLFAFHVSMVTGLFETQQNKSMFAIRGMEALTSHPKNLQASDLLPGANSYLDYICDSIMQRLPVMDDNRWPPENRL